MAEPTSRRRLLAAASVAQLATAVAGMAVAMRRRHPYDLLGMRGRADAITGDRDRFYTPELFRETAERIPRGQLRLYAFLTADQPGTRPAVTRPGEGRAG